MEYMVLLRSVYVVGGFYVEDFVNNEFYKCDFFRKNNCIFLYFLNYLYVFVS